MKFLIILNGSGGKDIGGGDYHMFQVMKEWSKMHDISLLIPMIGFLFCRTLLLDRYKVYLTSSGTKPIDSFRLIPTYSKRIIRAMLIHIREKPDVVICSTHLLFDTLPGFVLRYRFRAKFVIYVHHIISKQTDFRTGMLSRISILAERLSIPLIRRADILLVVNEKVREELINLGFEPGKILLSSNGVDYKAINSIKRVEDDIIYDACFCGRLVKRKGIYDLVDIWRLVTVRYPKSKLVIVGDGPEYDNLSVKVKESNLEENIHLMGFVSENDKYLTMKKSRIFIFPSYEEGWGIAVAEAIAAGLKVVLYDIGMYKIFEKNVIKVEKANIDEMAKIIIELIGHENKSDNRQHKLGSVSGILDWQDVANREIKSIIDSSSQ